jgi:protein-tyrosine phosphatase
MMIDTHCHLLPGLDDGPPTESEAVELARELAQTTRTVLCTPHFSWMFPTRHEDAVATAGALEQTLAAEGIALDLAVAAEVDPSYVLSASPGELFARSIAGRFLIVEVLAASPAALLATAAERLAGIGLLPILAHPERARVVQRRPAELDAARAGGALVQVVAPSLGGRWGSAVAKAAWRIVDTGRADLVGSDAHGVRSRRPRLHEAADAIERRLGASVRIELTERKPGLVLAGRHPG